MLLREVRAIYDRRFILEVQGYADVVKHALGLDDVHCSAQWLLPHFVLVVIGTGFLTQNIVAAKTAKTTSSMLLSLSRL